MMRMRGHELKGRTRGGEKKEAGTAPKWDEGPRVRTCDDRQVREHHGHVRGPRGAVRGAARDGGDDVEDGGSVEARGGAAAAHLGTELADGACAREQDTIEV